MSENGKLGNIGDVHPKYTDPLETYFDTIQQGVALPRKRWIVAPGWEPCDVTKLSEMQGAPEAAKFISRAMQLMLECHEIPRTWEMLMDFWVKLQCGTYITKGPNWIEPPVIATPIEILPNNGLGTLVDAAAGTPEIVASFTVPDRFAGTLLRFGNNIDNLTQVGNIQWNIQKNNAPVSGYNGFFGSLGAVADPRPMASHIPLKWGDLIEVTATKIAAGVDVTAFTRLQGFMFPAPKTDQTGDFAHYHTA